MDTEPNSREALLAALGSEADIIEVDIRSSRDGVIVLAHDEALDIPGRGRVEVDVLDWDDILLCRQAGGPSLLRFEEFLEIAGEAGWSRQGGEHGCRTMFNLDIKALPALRGTAELVRARGIGDSALFSGLYEDGVVLAGAEFREFTYFFNADGMMPSGLPGRGQADFVCGFALKHGCRGINLEWTLATKEFVDRAREVGQQVMLWTVDSGEGMEKVLDMHPDSVTTNYPDRLASLMERHVV
jgi:glycerophosphoryl diester phosphodiesterase